MMAAWRVCVKAASPDCNEAHSPVAGRFGAALPPQEASKTAIGTRIVMSRLLVIAPSTCGLGGMVP